MKHSNSLIFGNSNETFEFPNFREFKWSIWIPAFLGIQMKQWIPKYLGIQMKHLNSRIFGNSNEAFEFPNFRELKRSLLLSPLLTNIEVLLRKLNKRSYVNNNINIKPVGSGGPADSQSRAIYISLLHPHNFMFHFWIPGNPGIQMNRLIWTPRFS